MNDRERLAEAVAADLLNVDLLLVFADALEEAGDSERAIQQRELARRVAAWMGFLNDFRGYLRLQPTPQTLRKAEERLGRKKLAPVLSTVIAKLTTYHLSLPFQLNYAWDWCGDLLILLQCSPQIGELITVSDMQLNFNADLSDAQKDEIAKHLRLDPENPPVI